MPDIWMDVDIALAEVPVNIMPLLDDGDFKTREVAVAYDAAGMDLVWNFVTTAGAMTQTAVTPTTGGAHDWAHVGDGMYTIEIPDTGGTINNDTEGFGWFTGIATGVLPWRGPVIGFRAATLNDKLIDGAWSTTRGLTGTAVPDAASDAAGGLPISDAGGLPMDRLDAAITSRSSHAAADVWSVATRALTDKAGFSLAADQSAVTIGTVNALASGERTLIGTAVWATTVRSLTVVTGFGLAADQSAVTIGTVNLLATNAIVAASLATAAVTKIGQGVRDTGGFLASDSAYTIGNMARDVRAMARGSWKRTGSVWVMYDDDADGLADPAGGTALYKITRGTALRIGDSV